MADAVALFAYPLHAPGDPARARTEHLPSIGIPTFFCSGTRDAFGAPDELAAAAADVPDATLHLLEGADHGFAGGRARPRTEVWDEAIGALAGWLEGLG